MSITSKEIIKRIVHHDNPTRIGYKFLGDNPTDIMSMPSVRFINPKYDRYSEWGYYPEIVSQVPWFKGEVRVMENGNIYGRFDSKTKGECIKGVIQDGWELLESFVPPMIDEDYDREVEAKNYGASDKYLLAGVSMAVFAPLRDCRHMDNALMDVLLEPENICRFLDITTDLSVEATACGMTSRPCAISWATIPPARMLRLTSRLTSMPSSSAEDNACASISPRPTTRTMSATPI